MNDQATGERAGDSWASRLRATIVGLQCKSTVLVVGLLLSITVVLCSLSIEHAWRMTNRLERERTLEQAVMASKLAAALMQRDNRAQLQRLADEIATGDPLWFVVITDVQGRTLASADRSDAGIGSTSSEVIDRKGPIGVPVARSLPGDSGSYLEVTYPIRAWVEDSPGQEARRTELLGYVRVGMNRQRTLSEFDSAADLVVGIGTAIVLLSVPLGFLVVRRIVVPLNEMSHVARQLSRGDLTARTNIKRSDEIGVLADNLNDMADKVARHHREIVVLNTDLEKRVMERTAQLRELASREPLTGLYNRRHFAEVLARRFSEARRHRQDLSILMIDMDNFKSVNDEFGHQGGDELLILTAMTITNQLRAADVAARYGGDEFIVLLPQSSSDHAQILGQRIVAQFNAQVSKRLPHFSVGLSIGVASLSDSGAETDEDLIRESDEALYEAKARGKGRIFASGAAVQ